MPFFDLNWLEAPPRPPTKPVRVAILRPIVKAGYVGRGSGLPPQVEVDTSEGEGGHLGYVNSIFFGTDKAAVAVGFRVTTTSGAFTTIGSGEAAPEGELKWTLYRVFTNQSDEESMFSISPDIDISGGSWSGTAGKRFERPVFIPPGSYRLDFSAVLSENYEYSSIASVDTVIVVVRFEPDFFFAPDGTKCVGMRSFTNYNLTTGAHSKTYYYWDDDTDDIPIAVDMQTYPKHAVDWCAQLLARKIAGIETSDRRTKLDKEGYIDNSNNPGGWIKAISNLPNPVDGFGGALTQQTTVKAALMRILFESRHALDWTSYKARLIYITNPNDSITTQRTITMDDIERVSSDNPIPKLNVTWTEADEVINDIYARFKRDYSQSQGNRDSYIEALGRNYYLNSTRYIGTQQDEARFFFDWVVKEAWADEVTETWLFYYGRPKRIVEFEGFLNLLELQRGDIINFNLTPTITIGETGNSPDTNQGWGEGGWGSGKWGGVQLYPPGTIKGEVFAGILPSFLFMVEQMQVNWTTKRVRIRCREIKPAI